MKKIYLLAALSTLLVTTQATERVWNFSSGFVQIDHSGTPLAQAETWTSIKNAGIYYTAYSATKCTSSCTQALELCKNYNIINVSSTKLYLRNQPRVNNF